MTKAVHKSTQVLYIFLAVGVLFYSLAALLGYMSAGAFFSEAWYTALILEILLLLLGLFLFRLSFSSTQQFVSLLISLCLLFFGVVPLLDAGGLLSFLPVTVDLEVNQLVLILLVLLSSFYLIVDRYFLLIRNPSD